jgi:hypothetical protein
MRQQMNRERNIQQVVILNHPNPQREPKILNPGAGNSKNFKECGDA